MKEKTLYYCKNLKSIRKFSKSVNRKRNINAMTADLIRTTHSIEKGLSIKNTKLGFGHKKQEKMMNLIKLIEKQDSIYCKEAVVMAISAINQYIKYHEEQGYCDDFIIAMKKFIDDRKNMINDSYGGTIKIDCDKLKFDENVIEDFINSRHSIRIFSDKPVDKNVLIKAIKLAQRCPSACNRQGVRVYVIEKSKAQVVIKQLGGIGGFAESIDKIIIVTGKLSAYTYNESNQFIVSASIFTGYLSLTLHLYGLGACIIQRPVIWNKDEEKIKRTFNIANDEQIVCMLGVGNIEGKINVPVSHRLNIEEFAKFIG